MEICLGMNIIIVPFDKGCAFVVPFLSTSTHHEILLKTVKDEDKVITCVLALFTGKMIQENTLIL